MIWLIARREIVANFYSLRFFLSISLALLIFGVSSFCFYSQYSQELADYSRNIAREEEQASAQANNLGRLALHDRLLYPRPRSSSFLYQAMERYLPNLFVYDAFQIVDFQNREGAGNPFFPRAEELDWLFIIALVLSFGAVVFTYNSISGEKEQGTLGLQLANNIPRPAFLLGKYLGAMVSLLIPLVTGIVVSLLVLILSGKVRFHSRLWLEVLIFASISVLFLSSFVLLGLFVSSLTHSPATSLVLLLFLWVILALLIPNMGGILASELQPIPKREEIMERVSRVRSDIADSAPEETWNRDGNNPFRPSHRLRAQTLNKMLEAELNIRRDYYNSMFRQLDFARHLTRISPVALYKYSSEAVVGGGVLRFRGLMRRLESFRQVLLEFVHRQDATDPNSPHWINPEDDLFFSRQPVDYRIVPKFEEGRVHLSRRLTEVTLDLGLLVLFNLLFFGLAFISFLRYDVR